MRRLGMLIWAVLFMAAALVASADVYPLADGSKITGSFIGANDNGVLFKSDDGRDIDRVPWDNLTQEALHTLYANAKRPAEKAMIEPLLEEPRQPKAERKDFEVKPVEPPVRPSGSLGFLAIFSSPVGLFILFVLWAVTMFAAYEVALYRRRPPATVVGLAAIPFFGVLSPIIYLCVPTQLGEMETVAANAQRQFHETPPPADAPAPGTPAEPEAPAPVAAPAPAAPAALPETVVFRRQEFSFNRRFFETRLAGFFRMIPSEAEKDMLLVFKTSRGDFTGRRISKITPAELYLQTGAEGASAEEMLPFLEVLEVQIRHKDAV